MHFSRPWAHLPLNDKWLFILLKSAFMGKEIVQWDY